MNPPRSTGDGLGLISIPLDEGEKGRRLREFAQKQVGMLCGGKKSRQNFLVARSSGRNIVNSNSTSRRKLSEKLFQRLRDL